MKILSGKADLLIFDEISRDIVRLLHFPGDEIAFHYPTPSRISTKLGLNFSKVERRLKEMKSSGFLSEKLYMALNLDYLGLSKYILLAMAPTREVMAIYDRVKGDPPTFLESFYRTNVGPPSDTSLVVMEVVSEEGTLKEKLEYMSLKYKIDVLDNTVTKASYVSVKPETHHEEVVLSNLRRKDSLERKILRVLWDDTSLTVPMIAEKVIQGEGKSKYRTVKRALDSMVKLRVFWLYPQLDSTKLTGKTMFALTVICDDEKKVETTNKVLRLLSDNYIMFRDYYRGMIPIGCVYENRDEYINLLQRLNESHIDYMVYEDFYGFSTGKWPIPE
ncbi:hypothetical protein [Metallosphaera sedula]|uniref:Lrp/AsnC family transcriptional regulator n=3 Tax=Metallosphaera TaxID=41980 RepID=A4YFM8_METS5|nr:hypothetical protein [Metallosphaera sedula]MCY0863026.1 hypothetical protein [Metallosphaera prunae]ABP95230.1 hypothetical protein Msed_1066 [Metallosphaera sedula DSM 5348]AIM27216.1 hypothetical protein HA72_1066 [Metallosphaera sedula]AKV74110.1 hypothetical protein MsedA_1079 [Metallosphaera sedula]AKV76350.1 hypothetical protein MsedB_1081 [Metallosphaera sedula]